MDSEAQDAVRNPPALAAIVLAAAAAIALAGLFKADWDLETSFFTAVVAAMGALVAAVVAIGWSIGKRGQGWLSAVAALLASGAAIGWVSWTFLLLIRSAA